MNNLTGALKTSTITISEAAMCRRSYNQGLSGLQRVTWMWMDIVNKDETSIGEKLRRNIPVSMWSEREGPWSILVKHYNSMKANH